MIGITPAWLTFSGRNCLRAAVRPGGHARAWPTGSGIRRWLSVIAITPTTTAMNSPIKQQDRDDAVLARLRRSASRSSCPRGRSDR